MSEQFLFTELVHAPIQQIESTALGASGAPADRFVEADRGKCVKLGPSNNFIMAVAGDDIEGVVHSIEPFSVNVGHSFGSIVRGGRLMALAATGTVAVGAEVVASAQDALGTQHENMYPKVEAGTGTLSRWRCMRVVNVAATGDTILMERVV